MRVVAVERVDDIDYLPQMYRTAISGEFVLTDTATVLLTADCRGCDSMDLKTTAGLADACAKVVAAKKANAGYQKWVHRLANHLESVREANQDEFLTPAFQKELPD